MFERQDRGLRQRDGSHRVRGKPRTASEHIEEAAEFYGYSSRRFCDLIKEGLVLGISYNEGSYVFECEPYEIKGAITEEPREIILPRGTEKIQVLISHHSPVTGSVYYHTVRSNRKRLSISVEAEPGRSGIVLYICVWPNRFLDDQLPQISVVFV
jgi:hypothetical protein